MLLENFNNHRMLSPLPDGVDSMGEAELEHWLYELFSAGVVKKVFRGNQFEVVPKTTYIEEVKLKTKTKYVEKTLLKNIKYTPDYVVVWNEDSKYLGKLTSDKFADKDKIFRFVIDERAIELSNLNGLVSTGETVTILEVKPKVAGRNNSSFARFGLIQKILMHEFGLYVPVVVSQELFEKTFLPERLRLTDKKTMTRKSSMGKRSLNNFLDLP